MRTGRYTLALFLILSGLLLLLDNLGLLRSSAWHTVVRFWPVLLIFLGLEFLLEERFQWILVYLLVFLVGFIGVLVVRSVFSF